MRIRFSLWLSVLALVAAGAAQAQQGHGRAGQAPPPATESTAPRPSSSLPDSVRRVERQTGGEVLRAEPMQQDGHEVYRLKVLTRDGRVRVMQDDPNQPAHDSPRNDSASKPPKPKADKDGG